MWQKKCNIVNNNSKTNYDATNEITHNPEVLKSSLCDYSDAYISVRRDITFTAALETQVAFKNCAVVTLRITNVDEITIDETEDLDIVMPIYNLIQYSSNYSETSGQLWFYSKDKATNFDADIGNTD